MPSALNPLVSAREKLLQVFYGKCENVHNINLMEHRNSQCCSMCGSHCCFHHPHHFPGGSISLINYQIDKLNKLLQLKVAVLFQMGLTGSSASVSRRPLEKILQSLQTFLKDQQRNV